MNLFGDYIKIRRESLGVPQRKIAAYLDIDTSTLSKIERGDRRASVLMLKPLAEKLDLTLEDVEYYYIKDFFAKDFEELNHLKSSLKKLIKEL